MKYVQYYENMKSPILLDEYWEHGDLTGVIHFSLDYFKNWLNQYGDFDTTNEISKNIKTPVGCLKNINVYSEYKGQGYGNEILEHFIDKCIDNDVNVIILVADLDENQESGFDLVKWYESKGFETINYIYNNPVMELNF